MTINKKCVLILALLLISFTLTTSQIDEKSSENIS